MVGRADELARLRDVVRRGDRPCGLLLLGLSGVGKTRLLAEALDPRDGAVWVVGTHSGQAIPFGALADWVRSDGDDAADPAVGLAATAARLVQRATSPLVLAVDDAQLLDAMSATLIHRLVLSSGARVVLTAPVGASLPEPIEALWKDGWLGRLDLTPLGEHDIATLLHDVLGRPLETHSLRRLMAATGGSTLFLRELVESERASGGLELVDDTWYWRAPTTVPTSVVDLVRVRLNTVPAHVHEVCEPLAESEPLPVSVVEQLTSSRAVDDSELLQLTRSDSTSREGDPLLRLRHPLYGVALRSAMPAARRRRIRSRLADVLAARASADVGMDDLLTLQRATLTVDSDSEADAVVLLHGAAVASAWYDFVLAERLSRAALHSGAGAAARISLAAALTRQGRVREAVEELRLVLSDDPATAERATAESLLACIELWVKGDIDAGVARLEGVRGSVGEPAVESYLDALAACFAFFSGRPHDCIQLSANIEDSRTASADAVAWAAAARAITHGLAGRTQDALSSAAAGNAAVERTRAQRFIRLPIGNGEILALGLAGELSLVADRARDYERLTQAAAGAEISAAGSFFRGQAAWWRGELAAARRHLEDALTELRDFDSAGWSEQAMIVLVQTVAAQGDPGGARRVLERLETSPRGVYPAFTALLGLARAWAAAAESSPRRALRQLQRTAAVARSLDQAAVEVMAWHTAARWGLPVDLPRLRAVESRVEGPRAPLTIRHAEALRERRPDELDDVAVHWAAIGARGAAADAAAQAAMFHRKTGATAAAHASAMTALDIAHVTQARTPALLALSLPEALTRREREIATLASTGLTNSEIADRLVLSTRTVEGHLNRAYAKLQVTGRHELAPALALPIPALSVPDQG
jgi:DNA-binding CsgD family transcriptional regulator